MKLIHKYNRMILPAMALLFIASILSSYYLIRNALQNELDKGLLRTQSRIEQYVADHKALPVILAFNDQRVDFEKVNKAASGVVLTTSTQFIPEQHEYHRSRKLVFTIGVNGENYRVDITQPLEGIKHLTRVVAIIAMATVFLTLVLLLIINRSLFSRIWRPFYSSLETMRSFKVQNAQVPVFSTTGIEEFNLINQHFRQSAENAIRDYGILKEFTENASHEIRTPLAIIRGKLDLLVQQEGLSESQVGLFQSIYASITKLAKLQQSLSLLTKMENGQFHSHSEIVLDHEIQQKIEQFQELWQDKQIHPAVSLDKAVIHANKELLDILLNNLMSNATRHNVQNGSIEINLSSHSMKISNTGIREPLDPDRLFRRFYKQSPKSDNNGLGLSIIKAICDVSSASIFYQYDDGWHSFSLNW